MVGRSNTFNPYLYALANPTNYVDPTGRFAWFIPLLVAAAVTAGTFAIDAGSQVLQYTSQGMAFGDAIRHVDGWGSLGRAFEWGINVGVGMYTGGLLEGMVAKKLLTAGSAWLAGAALDTAWGIGWDMVVHQERFGSAFANNLIGFGIGEVAGYGLKAAGRGLRAVGRRLEGMLPSLPSSAFADGNLCSFNADTTVATPDGDIPISELAVGDAVLAYDESSGEVGTYTVSALHIHEDAEILNLVIDDELVITTPEHPFYVEGEWVAAGELTVGDTILQADGTTGMVESLEVVTDPQMMYNLTVDDVHTFFVGDGAWLVHNECRIWYGELDEYDRATGAFAHLEGELPRGTKISKGRNGWNPPNFDPDIHDRTHLLGALFGGNGSAQNRVIGFRDVNQGPMRDIERLIEKAIAAGEAIDYAVIPIFSEGNTSFIPDFISIEVSGNQGTRIIEMIPNIQGIP